MNFSPDKTVVFEDLIREVKNAALLKVLGGDLHDYQVCPFWIACVRFIKIIDLRETCEAADILFEQYFKFLLKTLVIKKISFAK